MNALISENEKVFDPNTEKEIGWRVAEVAEVTFKVALPLFWMSCSNDIQADAWYYDPEDKQIKQKPQIIIPAADTQPTVTGAQSL